MNPPADMSQGQWYALKIENPSAHPLQVGYSIQLHLNHQSLVALGANVYGNDLAIVSNQNGSTTALHRILDPQSNWNRNNTKIWFATDQTVPAQQTTAQQFYLVVGHPTLTARSNANQVFYRWADFRTNATFNTWNHTQSGAGITGRTVNSNDITLYAEASNVLVFSDYSHTPLSLPEGFVFESRAKSRPERGSFANCNRSQILAVRHAGNNQLFAALRLTDTGYYFESHDSSLGTTTSVPASEGTVGNSTWHTYGVAWEEDEIRLTRDGALLHQRSAGPPLPAPDEQSLRLGFRAIGDGRHCSSPGQAQLDVDWARVRYYNHPGPTASFTATP